jgi:hypothetical protein
MGKTAKQFGAVPYRSRRGAIEVLLVTSRKSKRWIVPKGWPKSSPQHTATAEAYEESGVLGKVHQEPLGSFEYRKKVGRGRQIWCTLELFPLVVHRESKRWPEKGERVRRWFRLSDAVERVNDSKLARVVQKLGQMAAASGTGRRG